MKFGIFLFLFLFSAGFAALKVGVGVVEMTPPIGSPSAGCFEREGGMKAIHDPLLAMALVIDNGEKLIAFCSVDHLGFLRDMVEEVVSQVQSQPGLEECHVFLSATHTHSGGGGYIELPDLGEWIAGKYCAALKQHYVDSAAQAIILAAQTREPARIGIGYGQLLDMTTFGGVFPETLEPPTDLTVIKAVRPDGTPLVLLFNCALYPDVLVSEGASADIRSLFSADVVGFVRDHIRECLSENIVPVFFNGAKGELLQNIPCPQDRFLSCDRIGKRVAEAVKTVWDSIEVKENLHISLFTNPHLFTPQPTPSGYLLPIEPYETEINLIVLDAEHAFVTIPAELSCSYDPVLRRMASQLGFERLSILDLVNDSNGYILSPESWRLKPEEAEFCWGGEWYGPLVATKIENLLRRAFLL